MDDIAIYTVRPNGTSLWIPGLLANSLGFEWGHHLTEEEYHSEEIEGLIKRRLQAEKGRKK